MKIRLIGPFKKGVSFSIPHEVFASTTILPVVGERFFQAYPRDGMLHFQIFSDSESDIVVDDHITEPTPESLNTNRQTLWTRIHNYRRVGEDLDLPEFPAPARGLYTTKLERRAYSIPYAPPPPPEMPNSVNDGGRDFACFAEYESLSDDQKELANKGYDDAERQFKKTWTPTPHDDVVLSSGGQAGNTQLIIDYSKPKPHISTGARLGQGLHRAFEYQDSAYNYKRGFQAYFCRFAVSLEDVVFTKQYTRETYANNGIKVGGRAIIHTNNPQYFSIVGAASQISGRQMEYAVFKVSTYFGVKYLCIHNTINAYVSATYRDVRFDYGEWGFAQIFDSIEFVGGYSHAAMFGDSIKSLPTIYYPRKDFDALSPAQQERVADAYKAAEAQANTDGTMVPLLDGQTIYNNGARLWWFVNFLNHPAQSTTPNTETVNLVDGKFVTDNPLDTSMQYRFKVLYNGHEATFDSTVAETGAAEREYVLKQYPQASAYFSSIQLIPSL